MGARHSRLARIALPIAVCLSLSCGDPHVDLLRDPCEPNDFMGEPLIDRIENVDGDVKITATASLIEETDSRPGTDEHRAYNRQVIDRIDGALADHGATILEERLNTGGITLEAPAGEFDFIACLQDISRLDYESDDALDCDELTVDQCQDVEQCYTIDGARVADSRDCVVSEPLACASINTLCGNAVTEARSPDGVCYVFNDTCIPDGFTTTQDQCFDRTLEACP